MAKIPITDSRRIKAIRQLAARVRPGRAGEYLDRIAEIASRKGDVSMVFKGKDPKPGSKKKTTRKETGGRNREDKGGVTRAPKE